MWWWLLYGNYYYYYDDDSAWWWSKYILHELGAILHHITSLLLSACQWVDTQQQGAEHHLEIITVGEEATVC